MFDDDALKDAADFKRTEFTEDAFELSMPSDSADIVLDHLVLHLGSAHKHKCRACYLAKKARKQARRRPTSGVTVHSTDAHEQPFGACLHLDFITMKHGSRAAKSAKAALIMTDEKTQWGEGRSWK